MHDDILVEVNNVSKKFCKDLKRSLWYGVKELSADFLGVSQDKSRLRKDEFWAVKDVSFQLRRGECLGLIGHNGAGKSTLLKMLNGLIRPDEGEIRMRGRVGALIELGAGFNPVLTGRENVYVNGQILGFSKKEIERKFDAIVDFAELEEFIDSPVQNYSSGMKVRLGFAVAAQIEPNILLIDEVLAVGDVNFQLKCFNKIGELRKNGTAIILVSHNSHQILTFATTGLVLEKGALVSLDKVEKAIEVYNRHFKELNSQGEIEKVVNGNEFFKIVDVKFEPALIDDKIWIENDKLKISVTYIALRSLPNCEVDIILRAPFQTGIDFFQANNKAYDYKLDISKGNGELSITLKGLNFNGLTLRLFFAIWLEDRVKCVFWWRNIPIQFPRKNFFTGLANYELDLNLSENKN